MNYESDLRTALFSCADPGFKTFHAKLVPTVDPDRIIGVRMPFLRQIAADHASELDCPNFLRQLPHTYYEEDNLHGIVLSEMGDYQRLMDGLQAFLPFVDNWATCDLIRPKLFRQAKVREAALPQLTRWLHAQAPYGVRFAIEMLMTYYLEADFDPAQLELVAGVDRQEYYIRMMAAWYFATALALQEDKTLPYLEEKRLSPWVHNKTIQKAIESNRITPSMKAHLRTLRIK